MRLLGRFIGCSAIVLALVLQVVVSARQGDKGDNRAGGSITAISGNVITATRRNGSAIDIVINENTSLLRNGSSATLADFRTGDLVKAEGAVNANGQFVATSVSAGDKVSVGGHGGGGDKANKSGGQITAVDVTSGTIAVTRRRGASDTIRIAPNATITRNGQPATLSDLKTGDFVKARGTRDTNGELVAETVAGSDHRPEKRSKQP